MSHQGRYTFWFLVLTLVCGHVESGKKFFKKELPAKRASTMAVEKFVGTWIEESKIQFEGLASALGLPASQTEFFKNATSRLTYSHNGDDWKIEVGVIGMPQTQTFHFRFGEPYDSTNIDGTPLKSVIKVDGDRLIETHERVGTPHFVMNIERSVDGDVMNATTSIAGVPMYTYYKRS